MKKERDENWNQKLCRIRWISVSRIRSIKGEGENRSYSIQ